MNECYKCEHRQEAIGSAHSSCHAADTGSLLLLMLAGKAPQFEPHGIKNGWANWPLNFDPVWLRHCPYFESKE